MMRLQNRLRKNRFEIALTALLVGLLCWGYFGSVSKLFADSSGSSGNGGFDRPDCLIYDCFSDAFLRAVLPSHGGEGSSSMRFERNVGQEDTKYSFVARGRRHTILLSSTEVLFRMQNSGSRTVRLWLDGAQTGATAAAQNPLSGHVNYLLGNDPSKWFTNIPTFGRITFSNAYPGVDVVYHGAGGFLENDFEVKPGADPAVVKIRFSGADQVRLESDGSIALDAAGITLRWKKPVLYQTNTAGLYRSVEGRFRMNNDGSVGFEVGAYDIKRPLVIDPLLTYATYFGGAATDAAARVATDALGNAYMVGGTDDNVFPVSSGAFSTSSPGAKGNVIVAKLAPDGKNMIYETHIGSGGGDIGWGIAVDASGNVYLTGMAGSSAFPHTTDLTTKAIADQMNCFVTKLNPSGSAVLYSTLIGGSTYDGCSSIGVDSAGNAYVTGVTDSSDFPTASPVQSQLTPGFAGSTAEDGFIAKLSPDGTKLLYSTFFGGSGTDAPTSIAVDAAGNAYFTGYTTSANFPVSANPLQATYGGAGGQISSMFTTGDAFVVKMNPSGTIAYSTYLGGSRDDIGMSIAIDSSGDAYVGGATLSTNFPVQQAFQQTLKGSGGEPRALGGDGFIVKLNPSGSQLLFGSYLGGSKDDRVLAIALDAAGNIYLAGHTLSTDFPVTGNPAQGSYAGDSSSTFKTGDAFVAQVSPAGSVIFATYLGGSGGDWAGGIAVDGGGGIIVSGGTNSTNFPVTGGVYQSKYGGAEPFFSGVPYGDAFIARFGGATGPQIAGISNAASYTSGSIAPGEAVLIAGVNLGPANLVGAAIDANGKLSSLIAGTQFLFDNVPAPVVYVSSGYASVIVPYEVAGKSSTQVVAVVNGTKSAPFTVPVTAAVPGIFTADASGSGQAAVLNGDGTFNSARNPAARGSTIAFFITGEGQTSPAGVTGSITASIIPPQLPVSVSFGSTPAANYAFVGEAPGEVAGLLQINVTIPDLAPTGNAVPLNVSIGTHNTQAGITIAIR